MILFKIMPNLSYLVGVHGLEMIVLGEDLQLGWIHLFKLDNTRGWNLIFFWHRVYCEDDFAFDCCLKQVEKLKGSLPNPDI